jgi:DNA-binding NarL/FixJ family response regulator
MTVTTSSVLVAESHHGVAEGLRGLLETVFDCVVIVADERSLTESAERLAPALVIVDLPLGRGDIGGLIKRLRGRCPGLLVLVLGTYEEPSVAEATIRSGADGFVAKRNIATGLLPMVDALLRGERPGAHVSGAAVVTGEVD